MEESDFWWLTKDIDWTTLSMCVGHHKSLTNDDDRRSIQYFHSLRNRSLVAEKEYYPLGFIPTWRKACNNTNVYRTLKLFKQEEKPILLGPFLIDIDSRLVNSYQEDLADALNVARNTIKLLNNDFNIRDSELHVFFSGRKGFSIEVRPSVLNISGSIDNQVRLSAKKLDEIITSLRQANGVTNNSTNVISNQGTVIDRIYGDRFDNYSLKHPYVRLHHSINKWVQKNGSEMARMKIELSLHELASLRIEQICERAEEL